jgi:hypothetical protein
VSAGTLDVLSLRHQRALAVGDVTVLRTRSLGATAGFMKVLGVAAIHQ